MGKACVAQIPSIVKLSERSVNTTLMSRNSNSQALVCCQWHDQGLECNT